MKFWITAGAALVIAGGVLGAANAQTGGEGGARGGGAMRGACRADIEQLCSGVEPGGGRIAQCLREHADRVSDTCKSAMSQARANRRNHPATTPATPTPDPAPN